MTGCNVRRCEQLETSPETIDQELHLPFTNTDRLKENYSIDTGKDEYYKTMRPMGHVPGAPSPKTEVVGERRCVPCLLRFDRSNLIVGQHHLTDDFLPATAVFGSPYAL